MNATPATQKADPTILGHIMRFEEQNNVLRGILGKVISLNQRMNGKIRDAAKEVAVPCPDALNPRLHTALDTYGALAYELERELTFIEVSLLG